MTTRSDELNRRLLGLLFGQPARVLQVAIAMGMAIGQELVHRGKLAELHKLGQDEALGMSACAAVLELWVKASKVDHVSEEDFQTLVDYIERIARAS